MNVRANIAGLFVQLAAIGHSIAVYQETSAGLGKHASTLTQAQVNGVEQVRFLR